MLGWNFAQIIVGRNEVSGSLYAIIIMTGEIA